MIKLVSKNNVNEEELYYYIIYICHKKQKKIAVVPTKPLSDNSSEIRHNFSAILSLIQCIPLVGHPVISQIFSLNIYIYIYIYI